MHWVLVANTNVCYLYDWKRSVSLQAIKNWTQPENRLKNIDFVSDRAGRYQAGKSDATAHGAYSEHQDAKEVAIDRFARQIGNYLNQNLSRFKHLTLIAEPHMHGLIMAHLDKPVKLVSNTIQKDIVNLTEKELLLFLKEHTRLK